ncbi:DNA replication complex GINS protein PSF3 [Monocercomonoides exilis]|uniref:DNA replication complex GINS protein PSF3 n=1 Tax=Monocercomonoides exilis TaxID=2049356 RepID=UPI00355A704B|nr:DNA replication complex GINS protein PSF3 [Monocercomonoides exilis]|eukprot:MONOS_16751.1-p1 / transcript=MONOS_16751.1 / gene=MONOS_16751 / organism=Monocercomonoides_exilis_PA203 / gene_product=DNA replication complex GINS protein PSF3 / transcript_product=DNA replication complex GINS protein PSF3 / location=Mono_scaffold00607:5031-5722(-) / protein_length=188 / sequence_SO=supercontig / SO=protein_coding / is_pseudo=false
MIERNYYDINDILFLEETVPISFTIDVPLIESLFKSSTNEDLKQGSVLQAPLYLAREMKAMEQLFRCPIPDSFSLQQQCFMESDPSNIDFKQIPYFYDFGIEVSKITTDKKMDIPGFLRNIWKTRYLEINKRGHNPQPLEDGAVVGRMARCEQIVYHMAKAHIEEYNQWKSGKRKKMLASPLSELLN